MAQARNKSGTQADTDCKQTQARRRMGRELLLLMRERGISTAEVIKGCKMYPVTVRQLGRTSPHARTLSKLASYLQERIREQGSGTK